MAEKKPRKKRETKPLPCVCYVLMPDRGPVRVEDLTPEETAQWHENMAKRLCINLSGYYSQHPDEYKKLINSGLAREPTQEDIEAFPWFDFENGRMRAGM